MLISGISTSANELPRYESLRNRTIPYMGSKINDENATGVHRYIITVASHDPGNTSDVECEALLDELDPFVVSLKTFRMHKKEQIRRGLRSNFEDSNDSNRVSDVSLWKEHVAATWMSSNDSSKPKKHLNDDGFRQQRLTDYHSAIWAWRLLEFLQEETQEGIRGSCLTRGWKYSTECNATYSVNNNDNTYGLPVINESVSVGNVEFHVGFNLEPGGISSKIWQQSSKRGYAHSSGNLVMIVDLHVSIAKILSMHEGISSFEPDKEVDAFGTCSVKDSCLNEVQSSNLWWNLDRVDQRGSNDGSYTWSACDDGSRSTVFVLDTGIRVSHQEFNDGRAMRGLNAFDLSLNSDDDHGHGTHVAGTIGGRWYGVAKGARVVAVKVLDRDGRGSLQSVLNGLEWTRLEVIDSYVDDLVHRRRVRRSLTNMSLGSGVSTSINRMVEQLTDLGIVNVAAAGNENQNACNVSPASHFRSITVGASTSSDKKASFSNFGLCVDIFAPGTDIRAAWHTSDTALNRIQGTSMAAPLVAGLAARHLTLYPYATPDEVSASISCTATGTLFGGQFRENGITGLSGFPFTSSLLSFYPKECSLNVSFPYLGPDRESANEFMNLVYWPVLREKLEPDLAWPIEGVYGSSGSGSSECRGRSCWIGCSNVGKCWNGYCTCPCNRVGVECQDTIKIHKLEGLSGSVTASNMATQNTDGSYEAYDVFSFLSPDWWFFIPVNPRTRTIQLSTCSSQTNFKTVMYVVSTCPHYFNTPYIVEALGHSDFTCPHGSNAARVFISLENGPVTAEDESGTKGLFGMVEGWDVSEGTFRLSWQISTHGPDVSSSPTRDPGHPDIQRISTSPTPTGTASKTASKSITPSEASSPTRSGTKYVTASHTPTSWLSPSIGRTASKSASHASSGSRTPSSSSTSAPYTSTSSVTPSISGTTFKSASHTSSGSRIPSSSPTVSKSASYTSSRSATPSVSGTASKSASHTSGGSRTSSSSSTSATYTSSSSVTPLISGTTFKSASHTSSGSRIPSSSSTVSKSASCTSSRSATPSVSGTASKSASHTSGGSTTLSTSSTASKGASYTSSSSVTLSVGGTASKSALHTSSGSSIPSSSSTVSKSDSCTSSRSATPSVSGTAFKSVLHTPSGSTTLSTSSTVSKGASYTSSSSVTLSVSGTASKSAAHTTSSSVTPSVSGTLFSSASRSPGGSDDSDSSGRSSIGRENTRIIVGIVIPVTICVFGIILFISWRRRKAATSMKRDRMRSHMAAQQIVDDENLEDITIDDSSNSRRPSESRNEPVHDAVLMPTDTSGDKY